MSTTIKQETSSNEETFLTISENYRNEPIEEVFLKQEVYEEDPNNYIQLDYGPEEGGVLFCEICGEKFPSKSHLFNHRCGAATSFVTEAFVCDTCSQRFVHEESLIQHKIIHSLQKVFSCEQCDKTFTKRDNLKRHMAVHSSVKVFRCKICRKKFTDEKLFFEHNRTHISQKPFTCPVCSKGLSDKRWLKYHLMTKHEHQDDLL